MVDATISAFIQALQENLIAPLQQMPVAQLKLLDTTHDQSVVDLQNVMGQLYAPPDPFQGKASDMLAVALEDYYAAENRLSTYVTDEISERISCFIQACQQVVSELETQIKALQASDPTVMAASTLVAGETVDLMGPDESPIVPIAQLVVVGLAGAAYIVGEVKQLAQVEQICAIVRQWEATMNELAAQPEPTLPPSLDLSQSVVVDMAGMNGLSPEQQREVNDAISRLTSLGYSVDYSEIEALVRAGYQFSDVVAAILQSGSFAVFNDTAVVSMMKQLTNAQQLKMVAIVEAYRKTHPDLTSHQVYNYLRYTQMKSQLISLMDDISGKNPSNPIAQTIATMYPANVLALVVRLQQKVGNNLLSITDPFTVTDNKLDGWYHNLTGAWGEWAIIQDYYKQGKLINFSAPTTGGEVDIQISESGVTKWVEVKNVQNLNNAWSKALQQAKNLVVNNGAKDVILQFPQQDASTGPSPQQMNNLTQLRKAYPGVNFEIRYGPSIPFDPPANNWGTYIP